jgi:hypothetical protein
MVGRQARIDALLDSAIVPPTVSQLTEKSAAGVSQQTAAVALSC